MRAAGWYSWYAPYIGNFTPLVSVRPNNVIPENDGTNGVSTFKYNFQYETHNWKLAANASWLQGSNGFNILAQTEKRQYTLTLSHNTYGALKIDYNIQNLSPYPDYSLDILSRYEGYDLVARVLPFEDKVQ